MTIVRILVTTERMTTTIVENHMRVVDLERPVMTEAPIIMKAKVPTARTMVGKTMAHVGLVDTTHMMAHANLVAIEDIMVEATITTIIEITTTMMHKKRASLGSG